MQFLSDMVKGAVIGIANIIPGVSGGTMAVSMGIYDRLIYALTDLFSSFRKSMATLLPIVIGVAAGLVGFTYAVEFLLREFALPTCLAFLGLILGGIPMLWRNFQKSRSKGGNRGLAGCVAAFLAMLAVSALLPMLHVAGEGGTASMSAPVWFLSGMIASATMVIPGVSGSMILMIMGYYYAVIGQLKDFLDALRALDFSELVPLAIPLFFFGIGVVLGIFLVAKCIRFLFERQPALTYSGILGLVAGAPVAMFQNTGALDDLALASGMIRLAVGAALLLLCFFAVYAMDRKTAKA